MNSIEEVLGIFEQVAAIPRGTKREQKISQWLQDRAAVHGFESRTDTAGNLVIRVPATPGFENVPVVVLQGHMDMVCEKTTDSNHDFTRDPIRIIRDGDWLRADKTTLGADNGIAIALALALAENENASRPRLELLFIVEEEIGIVGASSLDPGLITGTTMINLDSEEEGSFIVGCAGGKTTFITLPLSTVALPPNRGVLRLSVGGLQGGHSGSDIHKHRGNANKILGRALDRLLQNDIPIHLISLKGGTARNAIARDAEVIFACPIELSALCRERLTSFEQEISDEYSKTDSGLSMSLMPDQKENILMAISPERSKKTIQLLMTLPHGVIQMSSSIEGFVETSMNLAVVEIKGDGLHVTTNQRGSVMSRLDEINRRVEVTARLAGAEVSHTEGYPAWQPNMDSPLLERSIRVYESLFKQKPEVKIIHAGLECGIIGDRCGGLDMISFGPTIRNAHSPDEKLYIPSVERVWGLLAALCNCDS